MISIFDYGAGNLRSVQNTLGAIGAEYELIRDAEGLRRATRVILPGVGHFGQMMRSLDEMDARAALVESIHAGVPFLGICLGFQALFTGSDEAPEVRGLGVFEGRVKRFRGDMRIPHMGWDQVEALRPSRLMDGIGDKPYVYFAHSYYCTGGHGDRRDLRIHGAVHSCAGIRQYLRRCSFIRKNRGTLGLQIVRNFVES